jgi:hypothetical protein
VIERFDCEARKDHKFSVQELRQHDQERWQATINLGADELGLDHGPVAVLNEDDLRVTGSLSWSVNRKSDVSSTQKSVTCNGHKIAPGGWSREVDTIRGDTTCPVTGGLSLTLRKSNTPSIERIHELMNEMRQHMDDPERLDQLRTEVDALMNPDVDPKSFPVDIHLQLGIDCPIDGRFKSTRDRYDACEGTQERTRDFSRLQRFEGTAAILDFQGTYERGPHGKDTITATVSETEIGSNPEATWDCPPTTLLKKCELNITRRRAR